LDNTIASTVNLKELARLLNLSPTTVSRALNGFPEVNEKTRARVLAAAHETGYRPNRAAQRLATGKAGSIGLVMPVGQSEETDIHFAECLTGLGEVTMANDMQLVISPTTGNSEEQTFRLLASSGSVDGIFAQHVRNKDPRIALLKSLNIPFVVHGRQGGDSHDYPYLDIDNTTAFRQASRLLIQFGHRHIALLNGQSELSFAVRRETGLREALKEAGIAPRPELFTNTAMTDEQGFRGMMAALDNGEPPTAILCSSMALALGATRAATQRGLAIGHDISIIAHDDVFFYLKPENFSTPLTTTTSSLRKAGNRIAERLIAKVRGLPVTTEQEIWKTDLVMRASVGPAPRRKRRMIRAVE